MTTIVPVGGNYNSRQHSKYAHEAPWYGRLDVSRNETEDQRQRLVIRHQRQSTFDQTTDFQIPPHVVDEMEGMALYFFEMDPASRAQWNVLKGLDWATYTRLGQPRTKWWNGTFVSYKMMSEILDALNNRAAKFAPEGADGTEPAADDATSKLAKVLVSETERLSETKAARRDTLTKAMEASNDNEPAVYSTSEAAKKLNVTPCTLRRWYKHGRPIVGQKRKKRGELKGRVIRGHLFFEAASVDALAAKLAEWG